MSQRFDMQLVSKFKQGYAQVQKLNNGSWKILDPDSASTWNSRGKFPKHWQLWSRIIVNSPAETTTITPPEDCDVRRCSIRVRSSADVTFKCLAEKNHWKVLFPINDDPDAESPVTVNITISPDEDEEMEPGGN